MVPFVISLSGCMDAVCTSVVSCWSLGLLPRIVAFDDENLISVVTEID